MGLANFCHQIFYMINLYPDSQWQLIYWNLIWTKKAEPIWHVEMSSLFWFCLILAQRLKSSLLAVLYCTNCMVWLCLTRFLFEFRINCIGFLTKSCRAEKLFAEFPLFRSGKVSASFLSIKGSSALPFSINLPLTWNWPQIGTLDWAPRRLIPAKEKCKLCLLPILWPPHQTSNQLIIKFPNFNQQIIKFHNNDQQKYAMDLFHNHILSQQQTLNVSLGWVINFVSGTSLFLHWPKRVPCSIKFFLHFLYFSFFAPLLTFTELHLHNVNWCPLDFSVLLRLISDYTLTWVVFNDESHLCYSIFPYLRFIFVFREMPFPKTVSLALRELLVRTLQIRAAVTNGFIKVVTLIEEAVHTWNGKKGKNLWNLGYDEEH